MKGYELQNNEVVLFHTDVNSLISGDKSTKKIGQTVEEYLLLTNFNIVVIKTKKQMFRKETSEQSVYPLTEIKYYNNMPYVIKKGKIVEVYFNREEIFFEFKNKKESVKFGDILLRFLCGDSKFVRGVNKVKKEVKETSDKIGVTSATKVVSGIATDFAIELSEQQWASKKVKSVGILAKVIKGKAKKELPPVEDKNNSSI